MSFAAVGAFDEMRMKRIAFVFGKVAVQIGGKKVVDVIVR